MNTQPTRIETRNDFRKGIEAYKPGAKILVNKDLKYWFQEEIKRCIPFAPYSSWQPIGDMVLVTVEE